MCSAYKEKSYSFQHVFACLRVYHSCGTAVCKHTQTDKMHKPQTKLPIAGSPGKTGNAALSKKHKQQKDDLVQTWQLSFCEAWVTAHLHEQGEIVWFLAFILAVCWPKYTQWPFDLIQTEPLGEVCLHKRPVIFQATMVIKTAWYTVIKKTYVRSMW